MFIKEQLKAFMEEQFGMIINIENIGGESVLLYHDELDEKLIPKGISEFLPNPTLFNIYSINDDYEWIIGVAVEAVTYNPLFLVCIRDGERIFQKLFGATE